MAPALTMAPARTRKSVSAPPKGSVAFDWQWAFGVGRIHTGRCIGNHASPNAAAKKKQQHRKQQNNGASFGRAAIGEVQRDGNCTVATVAKDSTAGNMVTVNTQCDRTPRRVRRKVHRIARRADGLLPRRVLHRRRRVRARRRDAVARAPPRKAHRLHIQHTGPAFREERLTTRQGRARCRFSHRQSHVSSGIAVTD
eukprot:gene10189-biopygen7745